MPGTLTSPGYQVEFITPNPVIFAVSLKQCSRHGREIGR